MEKYVHIMKIDVTRPYNDLPNLPPLMEIETKRVLKHCIRARASLAELHKAAEVLPNQEVLINTLPLLEAQASSAIENIVTTTDKLFQYANAVSEKQIDSATKEALRYRTALKEGFEGIKKRPLSTATAKRVCSTLRGIDMDVRSVPGTTLSNQITGEIIYTPPEGKDLLLNKLSNWENFIHSDNDIDPLIKMAISHYQFEAIHPFTDGNGRTGRILNILYLIENNLLTIPVLYISRYIIQNKSDYYRLLLRVTLEESWEEWIIYMLNAIEKTSRWTSDKIQAILTLMKETRYYIKKNFPAIYSREFSDILFTQPYCRIANVVEAGIAKRQTAAVYLKQLAENGVLNEMHVGREKLFVNPRFMELLLTERNTYRGF